MNGTEGGPSYQSLVALLQNWRKPEMRGPLCNSIDQFTNVAKSSSNASSSTAAQQTPDDLTLLCGILKEKDCAADEELYQRIIELFHTLLRRPSNVKQMVGPRPGVPTAVVDCVKHCSRYKYVAPMRVAMLCLLRICGSGYVENKLVACDTVPSLLRAVEFCSQDPSAQGAAASCLQLIGETSMGRDDIRHHHGVSVLVSLLYHPVPTVVTRALGALHQLSADLQVCADVCQVGGAHVIVAILQSRPGAALTKVGAGIVQNLSRNKDCVKVVQSAGAVEAISPLLIDDDSTVQCSAVGALLNLHSGNTESREQLKRVISLTIVESALQGFNLDRLTNHLQRDGTPPTSTVALQQGEGEGDAESISKIPQPPTMSSSRESNGTLGSGSPILSDATSPVLRRSLERRQGSSSTPRTPRTSGGGLSARSSGDGVSTPRRHIDVVR